MAFQRLWSGVAIVWVGDRGLLWQRAVLDECLWVRGGVFVSFYIQLMPRLDVLGLRIDDVIFPDI